MADKIYTLDPKDGLKPWEEKPFSAESQIQELIADHPELLAGEQIEPEDPLRWILIRREMPVEGWAVDHLLIDQHARPTLVEVKRGTNPDNRRKVVGQMLDYAATASGVWSGNGMRSALEEDAGKRKTDPLAVMRTLLKPVDETDFEDLVDEFWERAATNLEANRLRLLFVADDIPSELERVVKFLNEQTRENIEVLAVEIKQFPGQSTQEKILVSRVIGQAESRRQNGRSSDSRRNMTLEEFLSNSPPEVQRSANTLIEAVNNAGGFITPSAGGIRVRGRCQFHSQPITVAHFYAPTENRPAEFDFRVRFDYTNQELQDLLNNWVTGFESDGLGQEYTRYNWLKGRTVQATVVSQNVDLLAERLKDVLTGLKKL